MNFNGSQAAISGSVIDPTIETRIQNIDTITTVAGITNFLGVLNLNGAPISGGSVPQPYIGNFEAGGFVKTGGTISQYLMANGSTLTQSAVSGNSNFYFYNNDTTITPAPLSGQIRYNNANQSLATILYINATTSDAVSIEVFFSQIDVLNDIYLQTKDSSANFIRYNITGVPTIIAGQYISIPILVSGLNYGGTGQTSFGSSTPLLLSFFINGVETNQRLSFLEDKTQNILNSETVQDYTEIAGKTGIVNGLKIHTTGIPLGLQSTLITSASDSDEMPFILPVLQATAGQVLTAIDTTGALIWTTPAVTSGMIAATNERWISTSIGSDTTGTGTLGQPYLTFAKTLIGAQYPLKINIRGTVSENLSLGAVNSNIAIQTNDPTNSQQSINTGTITTSGAMTRLKMAGFTVNVGIVTAMTFNDTGGRHSFTNMAWNCTNANSIDFGVNYTNWVNFQSCDFTGCTGSINLRTPTSGTNTAYFYDCGAINLTGGTNWVVYINGSTSFMTSTGSFAGTIVQLPLNSFNAVITSQAVFNAISTTGAYINQVVGLTGLTGATFGCAFIYTGAAKVLSLNFLQMAPCINVFNSSTFTNDSWTKNKNVAGGWIAVDATKTTALDAAVLGTALPIGATNAFIINMARVGVTTSIQGLLNLATSGVCLSITGSGTITGNIKPTVDLANDIGIVGGRYNAGFINTVYTNRVDAPTASTLLIGDNITNSITIGKGGITNTMAGLLNLTAAGAGLSMGASCTITGNMHPTTTDVGLLGNTTNRWLSSEVKTSNMDNLRVRNGATNGTLITTAAASADIVFKLPSTIGAAFNILQTDGSGNTSWTIATSTGGFTNLALNFGSTFVLGNFTFKVQTNGLSFTPLTGSRSITASWGSVTGGGAVGAFGAVTSLTVVTNPTFLNSPYGAGIVAQSFNIIISDETSGNVYLFDMINRSGLLACFITGRFY